MNKALYFYTLTLYFYTLRHKHKIKNLISLLLKNNGAVILNNGFILKFRKETKKDILALYLLSAEHGVEFSAKEGFWNFDSINNLVITPNGIKFRLQGFDTIFFQKLFFMIFIILKI